MAGWRNKKESFPLYKHQVENHPNDEPEFVMTASRAGSSNLHRLTFVAEEIFDEEESGNKLWNSKAEFGTGKVIRFTPIVHTV